MNTSNNDTNECASSDEDIDSSYDLKLRIISIFVILFVSFLGAAISVVSTRIKRFHVNPIIINTGKFFGSGVILATAFIHIFPTGMELLTDPCLPDSWNVYGAYAGLFAMMAALIMQLIEFIAHQRYHSIKQSKLHPMTVKNNPDSILKEQTIDRVSNVETISNRIDANAHHHHHGTMLDDDAENHKTSAYLLELGVALHSILIGLTLGTTADSFVALFIALSFHQFFEGIAIGSQIATAKRISIQAALFMITLFALTTPVGISIGIGIHSKNPNPKTITSLLVIGILDSLSGGILIYIALVNLISAEMGANAHGFLSLSKRLKLLYFIAMYAGAAAMAVIGRWA